MAQNKHTRIRLARQAELGHELSERGARQPRDLDTELTRSLQELLSLPFHTGEHERTEAISQREWASLVMAFPALHALAEELPRPRGRQSRSLLLWALAFAGEVGGEAALEQWCRDPLNWLMLRAWHRQATGADLACAPLTASVFSKYWSYATGTPDFIEDFEEAFMTVMLSAVQDLGAFDSDVVRDVLNPSPRHVVFADGTLCNARTDVQELSFEGCAETHTVVRGSRATTGPPRISNTGSFDKYGKTNIRAVNMITFAVEVGEPLRYTEEAVRAVEAGREQSWSRFVVAAGHSVNAPGATEKHLAMDLLRRLKRRCGSALHGVVYDMALESETSRLLHELDMPSYVLVAARGRAPKAHSADVFVRALQAGYDQDRKQRNEGARARSAEPRSLADLVADQAAQQHLRAAMSELEADLPNGQHLIVERRRVRLKSTVVRTGETITALRHRHSRGGGQSCEHILAVDNGALYDLGQPQAGLPSPRGRRLHACDARQQHTDDGVVWELDYPVLCEEQTTLFTLRLTPGGKDDLGKHIRVLPEGDPRFNRLYADGRNSIESYNDWAKRRLWRGRAMHDDIDKQRLDFFGIALRHNSRTWHERTQDS